MYKQSIRFVFMTVLTLLIGTTAQAQYARFDQTTDTISVSGNSVMTNAITMEARIMFTSSDDASIFREWKSGFEDKALGLHSHRLTGVTWPNYTTWGIFEPNQPVSLHTWNHIAYVYDGTEERMYINGTLIGAQPCSGPIYNALGGTWIGACQSDTVTVSSFQGYLDTFRLSTVARYSGASFTPPQGDLSSDANTNLLYNFNEAVGSTVVHDLSVNGRDGTFGNTSPEIVSSVTLARNFGDVNGDGICDDFDFNEVVTNFGNDYRIKYPGTMIYIPAGGFQMGNSNVGNDAVYHNADELPQHVVNLSGYWIGKYEVTRGEYKQFMDAGGYSNSAYWSEAGWLWKGTRTQPDWWATHLDRGSPPVGGFDQTDNHPVIVSSYYEAEAFCNWAGGHLPTEAQWEKAARWDNAKLHANVYPWDDAWDSTKCNSWNDLLYPGYQTAPVGSYGNPSPYGCMDMAGNVWEWCKDWYSDSYYSSSPANDPQGPSSGTQRVLRGGGYGPDNDGVYRAACRLNSAPTGGWDSRGFRLAR